MDVIPERPRAVRPRHAASLVLIDSSGEEPRILMGRRHARMKFIPDAFVFPGGKLDPGDLLARPATPLRAVTLKALNAAGTRTPLATALALAAVRETFEETGLMLSAPGHPGAGTGWEGFCEAGHAAALDGLDFIARAITPASSPIRFHARFFSAPAPQARGDLKGSGELLDLNWYPLSQARKLPLIDVTEFVLEEVAKRVAGSERPRPPLYSYRNERPLVRG